MQVIQDALATADLPHGAVATIGNYDGLHLGQRALIETVVERARELSAPAVVITFEPHPLAVLAPEEAPARLTTPAQRDALMAELGVEAVLVIRFTPTFAETPARSFVRDFLHERLGVRELYVGSDFSFGHRREGDLSLLRQMGESYGFVARSIDEVRRDGERVSSTRVRAMLRDGRVEEAHELLGRPYAITGIIARGDRMGQRLGWPTINVASDNELLPLDGVYASRVKLATFPASFESVTNIGTRPTVYENYERVVESHILDFRSDVYGEMVELSFYKRIRDEKMFPSTMELSAQIGRDVESAREYFRARERFEEGDEAVVGDDSSGFGSSPD